MSPQRIEALQHTKFNHAVDATDLGIAQGSQIENLTEKAVYQSVVAKLEDDQFFRNILKKALIEKHNEASVEENEVERIINFDGFKEVVQNYLRAYGNPPWNEYHAVRDVVAMIIDWYEDPNYDINLIYQNSKTYKQELAAFSVLRKETPEEERAVFEQVVTSIFIDLEKVSKQQLSDEQKQTLRTNLENFLENKKIALSDEVGSVVVFQDIVNCQPEAKGSQLDVLRLLGTTTQQAAQEPTQIILAYTRKSVGTISRIFEKFSGTPLLQIDDLIVSVQAAKDVRVFLDKPVIKRLLGL